MLAPTHELLFLQILQGRGNMQPFIKLGFTYSQLFSFIKDFREKGLLSYDKVTNDLLVTEKGIERIAGLNKSQHRKSSNSWISPLYEKQISKISSDVVYLPFKKKPRL